MKKPASPKDESLFLRSSKLIFFCALLFALMTLAWTTYREMQEQRKEDPRYSLLTFVLLPKDEERLPARYFAEKLGLSLDRPTNMYRFDIEAATRTLEADPILRSVTLRLFTPGILAIHYEARCPYLYLGDYENTAVDKEGVRIPCSPFFTPRRLPRLYCGKVEKGPIWGGKVDPRQWEVALQLLNSIASAPKAIGMTLQQIDLSRMHSATAESKEILIQVDEELFATSKELGRLYVQPIYLRLSAQQTEDGWARYEAFRLQRTLWTSTIQWKKGEKLPGDRVWKLPPMLLDLRLPDLGYWQSSLSCL